MIFMKRITLISIVFFATALSLSAQGIISRIEVKGNTIVSDSTIISKIKTRPQQTYNDNLINEDIKALYATGYFEHIEVEKKDTPQGAVVTFIFEEKPVIREVTVTGTKRIHRKRIEKLIDIKEGSFVDEYKIKETENTIRDLYYKKGFSQVQVTYRIDVDANNKAVIVFLIDEQDLIRIKKIVVKGNNTYPDKKIKKIMQTRQKGFFRRGILKREALEDDVKRIEDFYRQKGFNEVSVSYAIDYLQKNTYVTIAIEEGERYYIGKITVEGDQVISSEEIQKQIETQTEDVYVAGTVSNITNNIRGLYIDKGYIYADVRQVVFLNPQTGKIEITFNITEGQLAYVNAIEISGNVKTKENVIRREMRVYPGDVFEGTKIRKSRQRLENLGFFEEIRFDSQSSGKPNWEDLLVDVKEAKTGYLSFGGGYSSMDALTGFVELRQRNFDYRNWSTFTGAGQDLSIMASFGSMTEYYDVSFVNPWIFDKPVSLGLEGYKRSHEREEDVGYGYEEDIRGGAIRFGREFNDELKGWIGYRFETVDISDITDTASAALKAEAGTTDLSSIEIDLNYDTRDNVFAPSTGFYLGNSLQTTGGFLGGDKDFVRFFSNSSVFFPFVKKSVLEFRVRLGIAAPFSNTDEIPIYKRFFAGGASSIRGYRERKIGPLDSSNGDPIGGRSLFVGNIEYTYPVVDVLKFALFFDTGNVWVKEGDLLSGALKSSVGMGVRVKTPLGPLSLDYGWPLDKEPGQQDKEGRFHFSISKGF